MTKSRCSRTDLILTPNHFGQTFGLRTHARPDLRRVCVSARDVFASLVTGRCSVSVGDVSASLLRMCQRLSQGCFRVSTTSWIEHTLFPTSIYLWDRAEKMPLRLGCIYVLGQTVKGILSANWVRKCDKSIGISFLIHQTVRIALIWHFLGWCCKWAILVKIFMLVKDIMGARWVC